MAKVSSLLKVHNILFWAYTVFLNACLGWNLCLKIIKYCNAISFYGNIVRENVKCDMGLKEFQQNWPRAFKDKDIFNFPFCQMWRFECDISGWLCAWNWKSFLKTFSNIFTFFNFNICAMLRTPILNSMTAR